MPSTCLAALLAEQEGIVRPVLEKIGANLPQLTTIVGAEQDHLPKVSGGAEPQPSKLLVEVLEQAQDLAGTMKDDFVSAEHLLLALTRVDIEGP